MGEILAARSGREDDFMRIELEAALERRIPVVPLFLAAARMLGTEVLTGNLAPLRRRNGFPVDSGRDFNVHLTRLILALDEHHGEQPESFHQLRIRCAGGAGKLRGCPGMVCQDRGKTSGLGLPAPYGGAVG